MNPETITFTDLADDAVTSSSISISSPEQLRTLLTQLLSKEPRIVNLESETRNVLQVGVGGQFGFGQFLKQDRLPPYLCAKARAVIAKEHIEFLCGGTPTPIPPKLCLSFAETLQIAGYFFTTGGRDPNFEWVEV